MFGDFNRRISIKTSYASIMLLIALLLWLWNKAYGKDD